MFTEILIFRAFYLRLLFDRARAGTTPMLCIVRQCVAMTLVHIEQRDLRCRYLLYLIRM